MKQQQIIFIVGPTAVGKTLIACELALRLTGEIISCDAMQVYRQINVANDKPGADILKKVAHHLIGTVSVRTNFDVVRFRRMAIAAVGDIQRRGKIPFIVGGTGLYMTILLDGIFAGVGADEKIRQDLEQLAQEKGKEELFNRLCELDPAAAKKIHSNDSRRLIRALEVFYSSQKPISQLQKKRQGWWGRFDIKIFCLNRDRARLYEHIERRVDEMFEGGLIEEVQKLQGLKIGLTARQIIGMKEVGGYLLGEYDLEMAKELMKRNTRRYAKRQLTWFRRDKRLRWIDINEDDAPETLVSRILEEIKKDE